MTHTRAEIDFLSMIRASERRFVDECRSKPRIENELILESEFSRPRMSALQFIKFLLERKQRR